MISYNILDEKTEKILNEISEHARVKVGPIHQRTEDPDEPGMIESEVMIFKGKTINIRARLCYGYSENTIEDMRIEDLPIKLPFDKDLIIQIADGKVSQKEAFEHAEVLRTRKALEKAPKLKRLCEDPNLKDFSIIDRGDEMYRISLIDTDEGRIINVKNVEGVSSGLGKTAEEIDYWLGEGYSVLPNDTDSLLARKEELELALEQVKSDEYKESVIISGEAPLLESELEKEMDLVVDKLKETGAEVDPVEIDEFDYPDLDDGIDAFEL